MSGLRVMNAGARAVKSTDIDLIRELSDVARSTRRPGQTLEQRMRELKREAEDMFKGVFG